MQTMSTSSVKLQQGLAKSSYDQELCLPYANFVGSVDLPAHASSRLAMLVVLVPSGLLVLYLHGMLCCRWATATS